MSILIVDDSKAMRMIVRRTLRQAGYHHDLEEASSGADALKAVESDQVELVLCDWNMPEMNGLELLGRIQALGRPIRFGFVTSESSSEMRTLAEQSGAQFFITKPFTPDVFRSVLEPILGA
jgi:two-component system chemotaxis response regulator CheY